MTNAAQARFPDFLGIGAQKAGTTWLHKRLTQHRDLWVPPLKELHYFNVIHAPRGQEMAPLNQGRTEAALRQVRRVLDGKHPTAEKLKKIYALSLTGTREDMNDEWYSRIFAFVPKESVCGEITPDYAMLSDVGIAHILRLNPKMKFIFLMRDPISRGWSAMRMMQERAAEVGNAVDFQRMIGTVDFFARADYPATIQRFRANVPEENFLSLYFDDIAERPHDLLREVCAFLGVPFANAKFRNAEEPKYQGKSMELPADLYERLKQILRPVYERMLALDLPYARAWHDKHYTNAVPEAAQ